MRKEIKVLAFDMDGTLLDDEKNLSAYTVEVLNQAAILGLKYVPCSGRGAERIAPLLEEVSGIEYMISTNGAAITDYRSGEVVCEYTLDRKDAIRIFDYVEECGCDLRILIEDGYYDLQGKMREPFGMPADMTRGMEADCWIREKGFRDFITSNDHVIQKYVLVFNNIEEKFKAFDELVKIENLYVTYSHDLIVEISHPEATKGKALKRVAEIMNVPLENIMAIGDEHNDIPMFELAGIGVAMGNASDHVKAHADYITEKNTEHGVAKAIEKLYIEKMEKGKNAG